ncbi:MAG: hypothetical protein PUF23_07130 [Ruminococcus sp.]|nr:hypothetical protein [Ruminococcus sp.]MDD6532102.1 hypothetical protein [Ruminococcus sp.]
MVALYFTAFPNEAERYIKNVEEERIEERFNEMYGYPDEDFEDYEDNEEIKDSFIYEVISDYVNQLSVSELRSKLIDALIELYGKDFP